MCKKIQKTVIRIARIVKSLKSYSRKGEADPFEPNSLAEIVEDTLELCQKKSKMLITPILGLKYGYQPRTWKGKTKKTKGNKEKTAKGKT